MSNLNDGGIEGDRCTLHNMEVAADRRASDHINIHIK
jgi:hypothetical protein